MKRINSKYSEKKKQKRNQIIIGVVLIFVMFGSVFGIIVNSFGKEKDDTNANYGELEFLNENGYWFLEIGDFDFKFRYNPNEVQEISSSLKYLNNYYNKPLYIYSESPEATAEISFNMNPIVQRMQFACFDAKNCEDDLPIKTCEDNFIIIKEENKTDIVQEENCVFIKGPKENLTKISDEFLFKIIGIR